VSGLATRACRLVCLTALAAGCGSEPAPVRIELSWRFADDRPCDLAGAQYVALGDSSGTRRIYCDDGLAPQRFVIVETRQGGELSVQALSYAGAVLYRGDLTAGAAGPETVTLRFVGGE
jgi:hypothetical protein